MSHNSSVAEVAKKWDEIAMARNYAKKFPGLIASSREFMRGIDITLNDEVLVVGAGAGVEVAEVASKLGRFGKVVGMDLSNQLLLLEAQPRLAAMRRFERTSCLLCRDVLHPVHLADVRSRTYGGYFSKILLPNVLDEIDPGQWAPMLQTLAKMLKPNGQLIVDVPLMVNGETVPAGDFDPEYGITHFEPAVPGLYNGERIPCPAYTRFAPAELFEAVKKQAESLAVMAGLHLLMDMTVNRHFHQRVGTGSTTGESLDAQHRFNRILNASADLDSVVRELRNFLKDEIDVVPVQVRVTLVYPGRYGAPDNLIWPDILKADS